MLKTASGSPLVITVIHAYNDEAIELTSLRYTVYSATDAVLAGPMTVTDLDPSLGQTDVTISANLNTITDKYDMRSVKFELVTANGTYTHTEFYEIEGDVLKLTPNVDSFMTFTESLVVRRALVEPLDYWDGLDSPDKAKALESAFKRLTALRFALPGGAGTLADLDAASIAALDPKFLAALKNAQIVEANHLVEVNPVRDKIKMGIISETIGESSMFFSQKGGSNRTKISGLSDDASPYISKYLYKDTSNPQVWKLRRS